MFLVVQWKSYNNFEVNMVKIPDTFTDESTHTFMDIYI